MKDKFEYRKKISKVLFSDIVKYYGRLYKSKQEKRPTEIRNDLSICDETLRRFWELAGLSEEINDNRSDLSKIILLQTKFIKGTKYYDARQALLEEVRRSERRNAIHKILREKLENRRLQESRQQLAIVLNKVYEKRK